MLQGHLYLELCIFPVTTLTMGIMMRVQMLWVSLHLLATYENCVCFGKLLKLVGF